MMQRRDADTMPIGIAWAQKAAQDTTRLGKRLTDVEQVMRSLGSGSGTPGADGKTILSGSGVPSSGLGVDGDFYIDTTAHTIYGPKTSGAWGSSVSLVGPTGSTGATGAKGDKGDTGDTGPTGPGNLATDTLADAKGDIFVATGADTIARVPVGANASIIVADSAQTAGVRWESRAIVTSLPASPVDGQECYFQSAAMATNGWMPFHLRYNAGSSSAYKWEAVGPSPLTMQGAGGNVSVAYGTYADPAGGITALTLPLAGDYMVGAFARMVNNSSGNLCAGLIGIEVAGTLKQSADYTCGTVVNQGTNANINIRLNALAASSVCKLRATTVGSLNTNMFQPFLSFTPIRVG